MFPGTQEKEGLAGQLRWNHITATHAPSPYELGRTKGWAQMAYGTLQYCGDPWNALASGRPVSSISVAQGLFVWSTHSTVWAGGTVVWGIFILNRWNMHHGSYLHNPQVIVFGCNIATYGGFVCMSLSFSLRDSVLPKLDIKHGNSENQLLSKGKMK